MTYEEAKEELKSYRDNEKYVSGRLAHIQNLRDQAEKITSTISLVPGGDNYIQDKKADIIATYEDEIKDLGDIIREKQQLNNKIKEKIDKLSQPYNNILFKRYVLGISLESIADTYPYNRDVIKRKHGIAINIYRKL